MNVLRRRLRALACALLLVVTVSTATSDATAAQNRPRKRDTEQLRSLREQVQEASEEEAELLDRFDAARSLRLDLDERVAEVDAALAEEQIGLDRATDQLEDAQAELVGVVLRHDRVKTRFLDARDELRRRAIASYINQPAAQGANVLLQVGSIREVGATRVYLSAAVHKQSQIVLRVRGLEREVAELRKEVEDRQLEARIRFDEMVSRTRRLEEARAQEDAVRQEALRVEQHEKSLLDEAHARKEQFEAQIAALQGESSSLAALLRARQSGPAPPAHAGTLSSPIPGAVVTSMFGPRVHPIYGTVRSHDGIDFRGGFGTPIVASADGEVVWAGPRGGYGNMTVIDHGNSLATGYGHQQSILVQVGEHVTRGQLIGYVGSTGLSTGPHLHFEVRVNGTPANPLDWL